MNQRDLFGDRATDLPARFRYERELVDPEEERELVRQIQRLDFAPFEFHGFFGKRRVVSFGWRYDFNGGGLQKIGEMPDFLSRVRDAAARFSGLLPSALQQILVTEYSPGAAIGWHKDRSVFGDVLASRFLRHAPSGSARRRGQDGSAGHS